MNWLDWLLIAVLSFSALQSFRRGFTREIISLVAAIAALVLGMWFYGQAGTLIRPWVSSDRLANLAGFVLIVLVVLVTGAILARIVRSFVKAVGLSFFDRILGAVFGLIRGAVIAMSLLTAYMAFGPQGDSKTAPAAVVHSQIAPSLMAVSRVCVDAAPSELKRSFGTAYDEMKSEIGRIAKPDSTDKTNGDAAKK